MQKKALATQIAIVIGGLILGDSVLAQNKSLEEVVVTARKRDETVQSVPIAISALSEEDLKKSAINNISDFKAKVPSLSVTSGYGTSGTAILGIRGQVQTDSLLTLDPSVGIYVDDIYFARPKGSMLELYDTAGVEVLKGSQGTLYGRNTTGGAFKVTSKRADPADGLNGYISGGVGNYDQKSVEGAIGFAISDTAAVRIAARKDEHDGYTKSIIARPQSLTATGGANPPVLTGQVVESDDKDNESVRVSTMFLPTDRLTLQVIGDYAEDFNNGILTHNKPGDTLLRAAPAFAWTEGTPAFDTGYVNVVPATGSRYWGGAGIAEYRFDDFETKFIYGHRELKSDFQQDSDGSAFFVNAARSIQEAKQDSVEWQFYGEALDDKLNWLAGLYWFEETGSEEQRTITATGGAPDFIISGDVDNTSKSVFGSTTYSLTDELNISVGARYTKDEKELEGTSRFVTPGSVCFYNYKLPASANCRSTNKDDFSKFNWSLGIDWQITPDVMTYAKASTGYRSGGQNFRGFNAATLAPFDPEENTDFEIGVKSDLLDRRLRVNADYFYIKKDKVQQTIVIFPTPVDSNGSGVIGDTVNGVPDVSVSATQVINSGKADFSGVELEIKALVADNLTLEANGNYIDPIYDEVNGVRYQAQSVPRYQYLLGGTYDLPLSFGDLTFNVNYSYRAEMNSNPTDHSQLQKIDDVGLVNASLTLALTQYDIDVSLWGRNLTDEEYYASGILQSSARGLAQGVIGEPRVYGIRATKRF